MALPLPVNCTFDVYRHYDGAHLYPPADNPRYAGLSGHLRHHVKNGRFGYQALNLHWTHVLHVAPSTDIRSAYDCQLDPARDNGRADVVLVKDYPFVGWCTAFYVVLIVRKDRGTANDQLMCYLDRFGPQMPCFSTGVCPRCPDCVGATPRLLTFTVDTTYGDGIIFSDGLTRAHRWNGCWTLTQTSQCTWSYIGDNFRFVLSSANPVWRLQLFDDPVAGCLATYTAPFNSFDCNQPNVFSNPVFANTAGCGSGPSFPAAIQVQPVSGTTYCGCCPQEANMPVLHATIAQADDPACACLVGLTWTLTWNPSSRRWESPSQPVCGGTGAQFLDFYLECTTGGTNVSFYRLGVGTIVPYCTTDYVAPQPGGRCTPFDLRFRVQQNAGCCGSSTSDFTVRVTL
jgi:hypothetical protein